MSCYDYALAGGDPWLMLPSSAGNFAEHPLKAIEALQGYQAGVMLGTRTVTVRNAVAVINVIGPILRYANSRYVSTEVIALDFRAALDNPAIKAIVLNVDSPGGQASGISELAEMIYAARSKKKVVAYVGGVAASAAYWIASSASEVIVDATALLGSIGVAVTAAASNRTTTIISRNAPNKRPDAATEQGRAKIAETIDALAAVFTAKVARNLGVKPDRLLVMGDRGGIKVGAAAVRAGLAHRLGSFESLVASLNSGWQSKPNVSATASTLGAAPSVAMPVPTVQQITAGAPSLDEQAPPAASITTESIWRQRNARSLRPSAAERLIAARLRSASKAER